MSNHCLFDEFPIVLDRVLATKIGLNEALVVQQFHYWITINKKQKINLNEDKYWTFGKYEKWQEEHFPFMALRTLRRTINKLEDEGILISGNFNKLAYDKTKWYTINYDVLNLKCKEKEKEPEIIEPSNTDEHSCGQNGQSLNTDEHSCGQNGHMDVAKMDSSIRTNWPEGCGQNDQTYTRDYKETNKETNINYFINSSEIDPNPKKEKNNTANLFSSILSRSSGYTEADEAAPTITKEPVQPLANSLDLDNPVDRYRLWLQEMILRNGFGMKVDSRIGENLVILFINKGISLEDLGAIEDFMSTKQFPSEAAYMDYFKKCVNSGFKYHKNSKAQKKLNFSNFTQRDYDYDSLEKQLLGWD